LANQENDPFVKNFEKLEVLHGPFRGMKYPSFSAAGSAFFPKLLGCYEKELHGVINDLLKKTYTEVIDVGCAEGYYTVGLGLTLNCNTLYAYDTDDAARDLCYQMAKLNNVDNKIVIKETCTAAELAEFTFAGRALIICDCEGYEAELFTKSNISNLANCDLIIETHDFIDINISPTLIELFAATHHIQIVKSIDDIEKAQTYNYPETVGLKPEEKLKLFAEYRPAIMQWLICTPKNN